MSKNKQNGGNGTTKARDHKHQDKQTKKLSPRNLRESIDDYSLLAERDLSITLKK
jgi:hypothetical protein